MDKSILDKYTVVIGLEVHAQLLTQSKIYSTDSTTFGQRPNTNVGVVTLAHPGTLPLLNEKVVEYAARIGLACNCEISRVTIFDRKNYFYPDLPKGYQITQDRMPICRRGFVTIHVNGTERNIRLNRIHIEEDAGKSIHLTEEKDTLVDFNRAGVPLIEIVTEPDMHTSDEAYSLLTEIRKLVRYLEICDGNMEEGSLRCDANVSVMLKGALALGKKVEIKNMNSIRNVQRAIDHEVVRQISILEEGGLIVSETRLFDAGSGRTLGMRTKEELNDYRYFPDPDLSPVEISESWLDGIRESMPSLPRHLYQKFIEEYNLPAYDAQVLTDSRDIALYFDRMCKLTRNFKAASNWVMGPLKSSLKEQEITAHEFPVTPEMLAELIALVDEGTLSYTVASQMVFPELTKNSGRTALDVARQLNVLQERDHESILPIIEEIMKEYPLKVEEFKKGKKGIISMFMGEVMKRSKGRVDPKKANELLTKKLTEV
jgi:aspartyl-tRNA(Asn)/glutamyl-tRNA(Gln) amidotransferase subunit B